MVFVYFGIGMGVAGIVALLFFFVTLFFLRLGVSGAGMLGIPGAKITNMIFKSLQRNMLRTSLMYLAIFVLVLVITMVWSILWFLSLVTEDKAKDFKSIVTEKYQIPSQMPISYYNDLSADVEKLPGGQGAGAEDLMLWSFVGATLDIKNRTFENTLFMFAMDPTRLLKTPGKQAMMDGLDELSESEYAELERLVGEMARNKQGLIVGKERLKILNKEIGERIVATCINYRDDAGQYLEFEFEILGTFPEGRYDQTAVMNHSYLMDTMEAYRIKTGRTHPMLNKALNLVWIRLPNKEAFAEMGKIVDSSGKYSSPAIKMETASSGISSFLDAYRDLIWGMRYLLSPAIMVVMALVISNAISISVRERRTEMAVLKVLGFQPWQVMFLILGEALLIGIVSGLLSGGISYVLVQVMGGIKFPIAFFPAFFIPMDALWWGPLLGAGTAMAGSFLPAWSARSVKVSEVFSRVT